MEIYTEHQDSNGDKVKIQYLVDTDKITIKEFSELPYPQRPKFLANISEPSLILFLYNTIILKIWHYNGERHRLDGPAIEELYEDNSWYLFDTKICKTSHDITTIPEPFAEAQKYLEENDMVAFKLKYANT